MYADLDFFLALLKERDWIKTRAEEIYKNNYKEIWTSTITLQEIILYAVREGYNPSEYVEKILGLVRVEESIITIEICLGVTDLINKYNFTTFDAFHAMICEGDVIISSDKIYDKIGLKRIKLEEKD